MFTYEVNGVLLTFHTKLKTTAKIQKQFRTTVSALMEKLGEMRTEELIKLLYTGIDENDITFTEFEELLLENLGLQELYEMIKLFTYKLQYPDLDFDEIEEKLKEKQKELSEEEEKK